jgi:Stage II sporulation protein E (SpoIIE)
VSTRPSAAHRLAGPSIALSLAIAVAIASAAPADAGVLGGATSPLSALVGHAGSSTAALPSELPPKLDVQVGSLANVEVSPLPSVEVAGLPKLETPTVPKVEAPSTPPIETPSLPTASTPAPQLPAPQLPGSSASSPGSASSASTGTSAHAAGAGSAAASAGSTPAGANSASPATAGAGAGHSPVSRATRRRRGRASRSTSTTGRLSAAGGPATTAGAASPAVTLARPSAARSSPRKAAAGNPLTAIGRHIPFPVPVPDWSKPIILVLLALAIWFAVRSRLAAVRARRLERQRNTLLHDHGVMQAALVPVIPESLGDLSVSVAYEPADGPGAGGDFYDMFVLAPSKVAIVLGDVAGHGHGALKQAALTRYTLRAYMQAGLQPRAALALAGSALGKDRDKRFATVAIAIYDSASGRLTYACAGHPSPISIGFDTPEPLSICCSAPICCDLPTGRRQTTVSVPAAGAMCFFSDGLLEARQGDGFLGRERLTAIADQLGAKATAAALLQRVRDAAQTSADDMVACVVSSAVGAPAATDSVEELEVDAKMLGASRVRLFLGACGVNEAGVVSLLARASEIADEQGTALLRIERPRTGESRATALPGLSALDWPSGLAGATGAGEPALAVSTGR